MSEMVVGIPQGSPLSPLLGNLYLCDLDGAILGSHPHFLRYCDDLIVVEDAETGVRAAHGEIAELLAGLGLALNDAKTRVCRAEDGFVFLGYHFGATGRGPAVKAVEALEFRLAELAGAEPFDPAEIDALYRGWTGYFGPHPECWNGSPAGVLALLRAGGGGSPEDPPQDSEALVRARLGLAVDPAPGLALALGQAWIAAGRPDLAWFEMATACSGSRTDAADLDAWAKLLRTDRRPLAEIARGLSGPPGERLTRLAEVVACLGQYESARRLAGLASIEIAASEEAPRPAVQDLAAAADVGLLDAFFRGREGIHAVESAGRSGHRTFVPVHRPILADDWRAHLRGEVTLALPLVRAGNDALLGVLDVDVTRRALDERLGNAEPLLGRALSTSLRLRTELARRGCAALLEFSGRRGYHLWVRLDEPVPCSQLRRWLLDVVASIGPLPEGIQVEEFPNRDRVREGEIGPVVKLPLGVHSNSGRRCVLLGDRGEPLAEPFEAIRSLPRLAASVVREAPAAAPTAPGAPAVEPPVEPRIGPRARKMLDGCHVLAFLARKAEATRYLNHRERFSLLCALGHLGREGAEALHALIAHTYNYRPEITSRYIGRLPDSPISCPKLRELHPDAAALGGCRCEFNLRPGVYPTPLLFALKPSEIPAFRKRPPAGRAAATRTAMPVQGDSTPDGRRQPIGGPEREAEERVKKLAELKRHRRGIDGSIARLTAELDEIFTAASQDALQLSIGLLRRVPREGGDGFEFVIEV